jgi:hypothetical protein
VLLFGIERAHRHRLISVTGTLKTAAVRVEPVTRLLRGALRDAMVTGLMTVIGRFNCMTQGILKDCTEQHRRGKTD